jgi:hypothetical protein
MLNNLLRFALAFAAFGMASAAQAAVFSGTITGLGIGSLDASCAPAPARGVLDPSTSTGTSTLGSFTYGHNWCFYGASGPINGTFSLDFGDDELFGAVTGLATPTGTPLLTDLDLTYTIIGGTGMYAGVSGSFGGVGLSQLEPGVGSHFSLDFNGSVNAVPEPGTWGMMLVGFGAIGVWLRRRRPPLLPQAA